MWPQAGRHKSPQALNISPQPLLSSNLSDLKYVKYQCLQGQIYGNGDQTHIEGMVGQLAKFLEFFGEQKSANEQGNKKQQEKFEEHRIFFLNCAGVYARFMLIVNWQTQA